MMEPFWMSVKMQEKQAEFAAEVEHARLVQEAKQVSRKRPAPIVRQWLGLTLIKIGRRISEQQTSLAVDSCEV